MEESSTTLTQPRRRKPFKVSILFAPIYVPLLFLAAAISIPWTYIHKLKQRRQERKFAEQMKEARRLMNWEQFKQAIENGEGTAIGEHLSTKGPFRLWKTFRQLVHTNGNGNSTSRGWSQNSSLFSSGVMHDSRIPSRARRDWFPFRKKSENN